MSYDVYWTTTWDMNVVLIVVAAIVLVVSIAVLAQKTKGKKW